MSTLSRSTAAQELARRREIRSNLKEWAKYFGEDKGWVPALHHNVLLEKLQQITDGKLVNSQTGLPCKNLMVMMPPGAAKSSYSSVIFPTWFIQRRPNCRILACSYSADLIESFSRECRNGVAMHHKVLGYELEKDSRAVQEWSTTNGGSYRCSGVGAGLAGRRADAGVIDDYIGSQEDADSKLIRDKQWAWYLNDFWPRLKPDAIQIIVANRRHEDDLIGRLLEKEPHKWEQIRFPFFAEEGDVLGRKPGERLWPEWFTEEMAESIRALPARTQAGQYGQRPAPEEGNFFQKEWLQEYSREEYDRLMEKEIRVYGSGDWAVSEAKGSNKTCFGGAALDTDGTLYILPDLFWKAAGPKEVVSSFIEFLKRRNPMQFWSEKGHITKAWGPFLREQMQEQEVYNLITEVTPVKDKESRAASIRGRMSMLKVRFPRFATWWPTAMHELLMFPGGKSDDFVDFLSHLGMGINNMGRASVRPETQKEDLNTMRPLTMSWVKQSHNERNKMMRVKYSGR
jgi:hypothetical protein